MDKRLGRGLDSLISSTVETGGKGGQEVPLDSIRLSQQQPRRAFDEGKLEELAASISEHGVIQPIVVRRVGESLELVAGERRWRASRMAGRKTVPAIEIDAEGVKALEIALIENIQRENLDPLDEAAALQQIMLNSGQTQEELARRMGKSRSAIANSLRLLDLTAPIQDLVRAGQVSAGIARALLGCDSNEARENLARRASKEGWSVREVERRVRSEKPREKKKTKKEKDKRVLGYQRELEELLGTRVLIEGRRGGTGEVRIRYFSPSDLDRLVHVLLSVDPASEVVPGTAPTRMLDSAEG